jgi:hypothetical protein
MARAMLIETEHGCVVSGTPRLAAFGGATRSHCGNSCYATVPRGFQILRSASRRGVLGAQPDCEGFGRFGHKEFRRYLAMARAELLEVQNHLVDLKHRGWVAPAEVARLCDLADHAARVTARLRSSLNDR